ncbi:MAG: type II secretion system protein [Candidatus Omnitrophica bacterium]|nr:type II secretion system protein [Candidatus Omnitrophota bacterium]
MHFRKKREFAFSLIELLIVIVLVGILAAIAVARYGPVAESARAAEAYSVLAQAVAGEKAYYVDNTAYTTTFSNLDNFSATPSSSNFSFTINIAAAGSEYVLATAAGAPAGTTNYYMCIATGKKDKGAVICP